MKFKASGLVAIAALCFGTMTSGAVFAQGTWNFGDASCNPGGSPAAASCAVGGVTAAISAWGNTGTGGAFVQGNLGEFDPNGFGAYTGANETGTNAHHAFDNKTTACGTGGTTATGCGGSVEAMLLNFGSSKVSLSQIKIGFFSGDADASVYRWDGGALGAGLGGAVPTLGNTALTGWTLVGSNDMDLVNPYNTGNTKYSSYFLITTYFGASTTNLDKGNDAFKIVSATANLCVGGTLTGGNGGNGGNGSTCTPGNQTPEPGSLALMAVALVGAGFARRRKRG